MLRLLAFLALIVAPTVVIAQKDTVASDLIDHLLENFDEFQIGLDKLKKAEKEEDSFLKTLTRRDAESYEERINGLLDDALDVIATNLHERWLDEIDHIERDLAEMLDLREELIEARGNATAGQELRILDKILGRKHVPGSLEDIQARLAEVNTEIDANKGRRVRAVSGFVAELRSEYDIELDDDEAGAVLFGVNGALIVESAVVLNVLTEVDRQLQGRIASGISSETARSYHGIAAVTRLIHLRMLVLHEADYEGKWFPGLDQIEKKAIGLLFEARRQLENPALQDSSRFGYESNIRTHEHIIAIVGAYRDWLEKWRDQVRGDRELAEERAGVAINTLYTLNFLTDFQSLLVGHFGDFQTLGSIDIPELVPFNSLYTLNFLKNFRRLLVGHYSDFQMLGSVDIPELIPLDDEELLEEFIDISRQLVEV